MNTSYWVVAIVLFLTAWSGIVHISQMRSQSAILFVLHWALGLTAQCFAPYLAAFCGLGAAWLALTQLPSPLPAFTIVLYLLSACIFIQVYRRGNQSADALARALNSQPHRDPAENNPTSEAGKSAGGGMSWPGLRPFNWPRGDVERIRDVSYGDAGRHNLLDIFRPAKMTGKPMPILIQIPGGSWVAGSKSGQALPLLYHLASHGWLCFAINYRVGPESRFPAMLEDVLRAIAWVKHHAQEYGGDASFVALTGGSAGGHLASLAGLVKDRARLQHGFESEDTTVSAVVSLFGRYDFLDRNNLLGGDNVRRFLARKVMPCPPNEDPQLWDLASPIAQVHADAPPFFMLHGTHDTFIPVEEARAFRDALAAVSKNGLIYAELPGAQHGFDLVHSNFGSNAVLAIQSYLDARYRDSLDSRLVAGKST